MIFFTFATGGDPNAKDKNGDTPLMLACSYGKSEIAVLLLEHGELLYVVWKCFTNAVWHVGFQAKMILCA